MRLEDKLRLFLNIEKRKDVDINAIFLEEIRRKDKIPILMQYY